MSVMSFELEPSCGRVRKRKKKIHSCPNPLFEKWIREWRDEAMNKGWKSCYNYSKALKSLQKYPLLLKSGKEAKILEYFGDKICQMLDEKLAAHNGKSCDKPDDYDDDDNILPPLAQSQENASQNIANRKRLTLEEDNNLSPKKRPHPGVRENHVKKSYIPFPGTGAHAILVTLLNAETEESLSSLKKEELIEKAQPLCDTSFNTPKPGTFYTAWGCMSGLIKKNLVGKGGKPTRYGLTDAGRELANSLANVLTWKTLPPPLNKPTALDGMDIPPVDDIEDGSQGSSVPFMSSSQDSMGSDQKLHVSFTLQPGSFEVVLCVDVCETSTGPTAVRKLGILNELRRNGVPTNVRKLNVGDFIWIAQEKVHPIPGSLRLPVAHELVLDFIVERKRMDDLAASIKDGRYHEQKFRLRNCGLRRPVYLVEEYGTGQSFGIPKQSLEQAVTNTQVIDDFTVKRTNDHKETVAYLTLMTRYLQKKYSGKSLTSCSKEDRIANADLDQYMTFNEFNSSSIKNRRLTVKEVFAKQLLQLRGLSLDKVMAILDKYPTPARLIAAYDECQSELEQKKLLSSIKYGRNRRNIGPVLSEVIWHLYCRETYPD